MIMNKFCNEVIISGVINVITDINDKHIKFGIVNDDKSFNIKTGVIASGDIFCTEKWMSEKIRNKFNALCVEMEGASIAQVCYLDKIPFLVIRSITDKLDGSSKVDFETFLESSSKNAANILKEVLKKY